MVYPVAGNNTSEVGTSLGTEEKSESSFFLPAEARGIVCGTAVVLLFGYKGLLTVIHISGNTRQEIPFFFFFFKVGSE